ncbi:MAG: PrgI family protein [Candidatus Pacebacteria bacterium]|nr:PrgI family protein [Candidatus Paceibacterota bacterium]
MQFEVPQFIEVEDKIFGPLTFKQFIYLAGGAGLSFTLYSILPKYIAFLLIIPIMIFVSALAFYKINDKPFIFILEAFFKFLMKNKLYIWKKETKKMDIKKVEDKDIIDQLNVPRLSKNRLKELSWELDIQDK